MGLPFRRTAIIVLILTAGCGGGSTFVSPPPPPPPSVFSVALKPLAEDLAAAQALGWASGIPDADVTLTPKDSSAAPRTLRSSASGTVDFGVVAAGTYILEATRWLTPADVARLPAGDDVDGWVVKQLVTVPAQGGVQQVGIAASRRKGLVISEWAFNVAAPLPVGQTYWFGGFAEIYNNSDTTRYLDGLTIVQGLVYAFEFQGASCAWSSTYTNDPAGIWTGHVQQFPGQGRDYPLSPGQSAVIAIDAIDHSQIIFIGIDLSHANFEFWGGPADVDNPAVPNMTDTLSTARDILGHGPVVNNLGSALALARPYDPVTIQRTIIGSGTEYVRIPADLLLDVVTLFPNYDAGLERCRQMVNQRFDREASDERAKDNENLEYEYSISRRSVPTGPSSRVILQHSHNSAADFVRTRRSPSIVP